MQDYENAFAELATLGEKAWSDDSAKKRRLINNAQNLDIASSVLTRLIERDSFAGLCRFLTNHQVQSEYQATIKAQRKAMTVNTSTDTKDMEERIIQRLRTEQATPTNDTDDNMTAVICRILNVPPEVWESMTQEARDWILRERRHLRPMIEKTATKKDFSRRNHPLHRKQLVYLISIVKLT